VAELNGLNKCWSSPAAIGENDINARADFDLCGLGGIVIDPKRNMFGGESGSSRRRTAGDGAA